MRHFSGFVPEQTNHLLSSSQCLLPFFQERWFLSCVTHPFFFILCPSIGGKGNPRQKTDGETALHRFPYQIGKKPEGIYIPSFSTFLEPDKILWAATKMLLMFADIYALLPLIAGRTVNFSAACVATVYCSLYFSGGASHSEATSTETVD